MENIYLAFNERWIGNPTCCRHKYQQNLIVTSLQNIIKISNKKILKILYEIMHNLLIYF